MSLSGTLKSCAMAAAAAGVCASAQASKLVEVRSVDDQHLMVYWQDARVNYQDDGKGPTAFMGHETRGGETMTNYGPLDTKAAQVAGNYTIASKDDQSYAQPLAATAAYRKTKVSGTDTSWPDAKYSLEHTIYLQLPQKMQQGKHYTLNINPAVNTDTTSSEIVFDIFKSISEAIHVNIIGYQPEQTAMKSADLYIWMGDGGARDYSDYVGKPVMLYSVESGEKHPVGAVKFWKKSGKDFGGWNLTRSDVWTCDFSGFAGTGKYRLVVEGVGCSPDFEIRKDIYYEPFKTSVRGYFYMRIGMGKEFTPVPRQPRLIQGVDPVDLKIYRTTYGPWHPDWKTGGDTWDKTDWSKYNEPGNPTNPDAWGGHSDATDWDRNPSHISNIWDMLLPYILSNGKIGDDNLGIAESGNGIPDIIDEARYEVDFWLRCRDGNGGYCAGVNNPPRDHKTLYQAAARPFMAWASAANAAILADAFRIAGRPGLMSVYRDAAISAWKTANEQDLDETSGIGNATIRGRDLKMLAAASLYNITGDAAYEEVVAKETALNAAANIDEKDKYSQYWPTASYLMCDKFKWQPIHYPELVQKMQKSVIDEAMRKNVVNSETFPSRRSSDSIYGWFQATQFCDALCIAHAVASDPKDQERLLRAMILETDYGLGRNCLNMVHMTGLGSRAVEDIYTTGRNDGTPGVHPGHTPYMNSEAWGTDKKGAYQHDPKGWYGSRGYPAWDQWPQGEALWHARYCYCNNEFTPQQTMRGKTALLGYLYSLGETHKGQ